MRIAGQIFGAFYAAFGAITSILDVLDWADMVKAFPQFPNTSDLVYGHILVFFVGVALSVFGGYVFVKSRAPKH